MTIYIDIVIVENVIMKSIILYATAVILRDKVHYMQIIISSIIRCNIFSINIYISDKSL